MMIILNSDILYTPHFIRNGLPKGLREFLKFCNSGGHSIIIPQTTLLEFEYRQSKYIKTEVDKISKAFEVLKENDIDYEETDPAERFKHPDLIELIKEINPNVRIELPAIEDFSDAHRRACRHESPGQPEASSDEMRDLVIWAIALRLAASNRETLLISKDTIHNCALGNAEADAVHLVRKKTINEASDYLYCDTPAGILFKNFVGAVWEDLHASGLPISRTPSIIGVSNPSFVQGSHALMKASCHMTIGTRDSSILKAHVEIGFNDNIMVSLVMSEMSVNDTPLDEQTIVLKPMKPVQLEQSSPEERILALKKAIGG